MADLSKNIVGDRLEIANEIKSTQASSLSPSDYQVSIQEIRSINQTHSERNSQMATTSAILPQIYFSTDTIQSKPYGKSSREEFSEAHRAEATEKKGVPWGQVGENGVGLSGPNDPAAVLPIFELSSQRNEPKRHEKMVPWGQVGIGLTGGEMSISGPHRLSRPGVESASGKEPDWELLKTLLN